MCLLYMVERTMLSLINVQMLQNFIIHLTGDVIKSLFLVATLLKANILVSDQHDEFNA